MGLTVTEDTPADMLAGNMELLVQLPPRNDDDYENDETYEGDEDEHRHQHGRNHHRYHNHHITNGHHPRRTGNGNARRVTVARSTPMMDLLVQVATSQKLSASSYTLEAIGEHGLVLTHHPNTPIGALDALQVKLLPKQGTFAPMKTRHANQPFEPTFRLQVHLPRNQLYVSRVSSRMNLGKILDEVCREKNLDRNNYELRHPANIEETLDLSLSLQDYHLQEVTLCPKRRPLGSSLSSQDIMALQRQEERRRQEAKQSVFGFAFKKSKESSLSTDSLGERSVSPARSVGTGRSVSPQAPTAPTRPQRKRRPAPKPPLPRAEVETSPSTKGAKNPEKDKEGEREKEREKAERTIISHSRNSSDSSGYHEASVLSDNLDSNIRVPETLPRRSRLQTPSSVESTGRTLAETSQASKSLGNLAAASNQRTSTIARVTSNSSLSSAGLRKKKAAPAPPPPRPLTSSTSIQALERIVDSEESFTSVAETSLPTKASSDVAVGTTKSRLQAQPRVSLGSENRASITPKIDEARVEDKPAAINVDSARFYESPILSEKSAPSVNPSPKIVEVAAIIPNVEIASERKRVAPVPKPRGLVHGLENAANTSAPPKNSPPYLPSPTPRDQTTQKADAAVQIAPNTSPATTTTDLLKKVSDTLSSSLMRSQATVAAVSSLAKDLEPPVESKKADKPMARDEESASRPDVGEDAPDFIDAHQPALPDWEYQLPEPPSGFRDTEVPTAKEGGKIVITEPVPVRELEKLIADEELKDRTAVEAKRREVSAPVSPTTKVPPINDDDGHHQSKRSRRKSGSENSSRRTSHVSSTPGVAPVDNTLSNFVITTYSRPKNVDIFDEIERADRDPELPLSRKSSSASQTRRESSRSSTSSLPQSEERQLGSVDETPQRPEVAPPVRGDDGSPHMVSRANIKISIVAKPRSRGNSVSGNQALKAAVRDASDDGRGVSDVTVLDEKTANNEKFSQWRENILKKQETPSRERQLQSLQVLRGISLQIEDSQPQPDDTSTAEKAAPTSAVETRVETVKSPNNGETAAEPSPQTTPPAPVAAPIEPHVKRYTYAGPPAIDLGSWSDRSRTKVQIKPDTDYKFEKSPIPGTARIQQDAPKTLNYKEGNAVSRTVLNAVSQTAVTPSVVKNTLTKSSRSEKESTVDNHDRKEPNELARTLITRTTASGFKRPASIAVFESSVTISGEKETQKRPEVVNGTGNQEESNKASAATESEVDTRPLSFKELKQAFAREQNGSVQPVPKFGSLGRRAENSISGTLVRRDNESENQTSFRNEVNGQRGENKTVASEKKNFVTPANRGTAVFQHDVLGTARRTSRGTLMPVVKGFKVVPSEEEPVTLSQDKPHIHRVAIGDISNGNYVAAHNGLRKTVVQIKGDNQISNSNNIPKPPPTMPVITGVTLKSTNANARPKSMIVAADPRNDLLESIRGFGGSGQLRHVSRRNTNIGGGSSSRFVHS
ncbi:mucin-5AC isoform X1 [Neodiprion lecontei]|uniref:Mucin-5AC isoform X1 n=1 Tax=Neodiprion lecontei TaxID=441921 RepID=A0ABM3G3X1_NEOLC|nr:mucin-5AC isoform X1 [Neodiprion lecontei]